MSAALMKLFIRTREINTPGVLEKPGFDAWPPAITANGDRFEPIILIWSDRHIRSRQSHRERRNNYRFRSIRSGADFDNASRCLRRREHVMRVVAHIVRGGWPPSQRLMDKAETCFNIPG